MSIPEDSKASRRTNFESLPTYCELESARHTTRRHKEEDLDDDCSGGDGGGLEWNFGNFERLVSKEALGIHGEDEAPEAANEVIVFRLYERERGELSEKRVAEHFDNSDRWRQEGIYSFVKYA